MEQTTHPTNKKTFWARWRIIILVVSIGFALRIWAAWQLPVDFDEPIYVEDGYQYAQLIQAGDINGIIDYSGTSEHPPLVKLIYGLSYLISGSGIPWLQALFISRIVSAIFGTLTVFFVALVNPLAGGLMAVQTLMVKYSSQAYLEAIPLFFSLLAVFAHIRSRTGWNKWLFLSAIALGVAGAGKYSYFPILLVILYLMVWERHERITTILGYLLIVVVTFFVFNPYLWHDPIQRLIESLAFHTQYAQGAHVQEVNYPWYQPIWWLSRSHGFLWHPEVFFYMGFDGLIFLFALTGMWLEWKHRRWVALWGITGVLVLLSWPTKWPQYTLVVLPAFCLAASTALKAGYEWLREQELYWEWFQNMFPRPSRRYIIIGASLLGLLIVGALASQVIIAINRLGWSSMSTETTGVPGDSVNDLLLLPDGRMLVATDAGAAFWRAAGDDGVIDNWEVLNQGNSPLPDAHVLSVAQDQKGTFWFGTASGLASLDGETWEVFRSDDFGMGSDQVNAIAVDERNQVWIGTMGGAAVYDGIAWQSFNSATSGLLNDAVFSIAIEESNGEGMVWFGTLRGVSRLDKATGQWQSYTSQDIDLGWGGVADLFIDSAGRIWICTEGGGISLWDGTSWSYLRVSNSELPYSIVETVTEIEPGIFWIASSIPNSTGGVVAWFDGMDWRTYRQGFSGYSGAETIVIAEDRLGRIWFGTRTKGIIIYEPKK